MSFTRRNKYFMAVYGQNRLDIHWRMKELVPQEDFTEVCSQCDVYQNTVYDTGLPKEMVWQDRMGLLVHGIVFPWEISLDAMSEDPGIYFRKSISKYRTRPEQLPLAFRNGSFVGIAIDSTSDTIYAFTSFLNSIPLYFAFYDRCLLVGTDFHLLAKVIAIDLDKISVGLIEYYTQGTILSNSTALDAISSVPKGAYLKSTHGKIDVDFYYTMPVVSEEGKFSVYVNEFARLWESTLENISSRKYPFGLGLTGGVDSRLIYSALPPNSESLAYTGSHPLHPDYLIARRLVNKGQPVRYVLEDYRQTDKLGGYARYCSLSDNPLHSNSLTYYAQLQFREEHGLTYELIGLTEFLGGVYHYLDRRDMANAFRMSLPVRYHAMSEIQYTPEQILDLGLRNQVLCDDLQRFPCQQVNELHCARLTFFRDSLRQLGEVEYLEHYLERFRHVHKMANLLTWSSLAGRRFNEHLSPSMNMELTDLACKIPLRFRDSRRLLFAYLNRYHPETARIVLSGYLFSARSPWFLYKILGPHVKVLNHLGIKVPLLQWYIRKNNYRPISSLPEIYRLQRAVCRDTSIIKDSVFHDFLQNYPNDKIRLMRLFNIAVLHKRLELGEDGLLDFLLAHVDKLRKSGSPD